MKLELLKHQPKAADRRDSYLDLVSSK